jgi:hypothetical protein
VLNCRFGYRASSAGVVDWSDGFIGSMDDRPARVQNNSFDNLLYAAYAAETLDQDPMLCEKLLSVAEEDFAFALAGFRVQSMDYVLDCQRTDPLGDSGLRVFFYRDRDKRVIQHFNHQSKLLGIFVL